MKHLVTQENLARELARLPGMDRQELVEYWLKLYNALPPANLSRRLLLWGTAYRLQEKVLGGLRPATRRLLTKIAKENKAVEQLQKNTARVGAQLIREWNGRTYEVTILEDGVLFQGKQYRSLTEVASLITGVKWSGPLFFGLRGKRQVRRS
ncbi:MAG TPA: DUF2924 domain-containing protein [Rickettsiales bacterium]|nr:DUF2924 domain-containing protein [Rickettsiales bacterium]